VAFWQDIGRALRGIYETFTTGRPSEPEEYEEEIEELPDEEEPYIPFGYEDEEPPQQQEDYGDDTFSYFGDGPYPFGWDEAEQTFWDRQMDGYVFADQGQYDNLQSQFYDAYMRDDISTEDRVAARAEFLDESFIADIDWDAFRDYHGYNES